MRHLSLPKNLFLYFRLAVAIVRSMKNKQLNAYNEWNSKKPKPIESKVLDPSHEVKIKYLNCLCMMVLYRHIIRYIHTYYFYNLGRKACK